jgi:hypothetical protein
MGLVITLSPEEERQLAEDAKQQGLEPSDYASKLLKGNLRPMTSEEKALAKIREWQEAEGMKLGPHRTAREHFAQLEAEAASMTDEELEAEDRLWEEFMKGINETRAAMGMRLL